MTAPRACLLYGLATLAAVALVLVGCGGGGGGPIPPVLVSVTPSVGGTPGGTTVVLAGSRLGTGSVAALQVRFGGLPATSVVVVDDSTLEATTPARAAGVVDVEVDTDHGSSMLASAFTYVPAPGLSACEPALGPLGGGQQVTLTGSGFLLVTQVRVGAATATSLAISSDTLLTCVVPAQAALGPYDVQVVSSDGIATLAQGWRAVPPPTITTLSLGDGPAGGNTPITLTGTNLAVGGLSVSVGGATARAVVATSATQVTFRTPPGTAGARNVVVTTYGGSATRASGYTYTTFTPSGVLFPNQWHLENTGQSTAVTGEDASVRGAWDLGYTGRGVQVGVCDDGLELAHEDLAANVIPGVSWDYPDSDGDPTRDEHGTSVAGVTSAVGTNSLGGTGAAPRSTMAGFAVITAGATDADIADSWARSLDVLDAFNNSWGSPAEWDGDWYGYSAAPSSFTDSLEAGLAQARGGLGAIYMKAAGNGGTDVSASFDSTNSLRGVITIGAVGGGGSASSYSQPGPAVLVCAPSNASGYPGITTTDRTGALGYGAGNYTNSFGGTSSATPLATGVVALVLEANPLLRWWEVPLVLARSARRNHAAHPDWTTNAAGHWVNHQYGFGVVDADAAVRLARDFETTGSLASWSGSASVNQTVPRGSATGVTSTITVPAGSGVAAAHCVRVTLSCSHAVASDLDITLTSPTGTVSRLVESPGRISGLTILNNSLSGVVLASWRHLDEAVAGAWTLTVADTAGLLDSTWTSWTLAIEGEAEVGGAPMLAKQALPAGRPAQPALAGGQSAWWDGTSWRTATLEPRLLAEWTRPGEASWVAAHRDVQATLRASQGFRIWRLAPGAGSAAVRTQAPVGRGGSAWPVYRDGDGGRLRALTGRLVLRTAGLDAAGEQALLAAHGLELVRRMAGSRLLVRVRAADDPLALARLLLEAPGVAHAEPDWWQERVPQ